MNRDPVPRLSRAMERWGPNVRRLVLELGPKTLAEFEYDGGAAHIAELAQQLAELGSDTAEGYERDISCQLSAYDGNGKAIGSAPVRFYRAVYEEKESGDGPAAKQVAQLLRHNEQLQERFLGLSEQQSQGLSRALDAQGRVLDTLSKRLADAEQQLREAQGRETEAQAVAREALSLVETAMQQAPNAGFKVLLEKLGATFELFAKGKKMLEEQTGLDIGKALEASKVVAAAANGASSTPPETQETVSSDGGGR